MIKFVCIQSVNGTFIKDCIYYMDTISHLNTFDNSEFFTKGIYDSDLKFIGNYNNGVTIYFKDFVEYRNDQIDKIL